MLPFSEVSLLIAEFNCCFNTETEMNSLIQFIVGLSLFRKFFARLKFSPALFEKIPSFVCLVFKIENKLILKLQNLFS